MAQPSQTGQSVHPSVWAGISHRLSLWWGPSPGATAMVFHGLLSSAPWALPPFPRRGSPSFSQCIGAPFPFSSLLSTGSSCKVEADVHTWTGTGSAHPCATYTNTGSAAELITMSSGSKRSTQNERTLSPPTSCQWCCGQNLSAATSQQCCTAVCTKLGGCSSLSLWETSLYALWPQRATELQCGAPCSLVSLLDAPTAGVVSLSCFSVYISGITFGTWQPHHCEPLCFWDRAVCRNGCKK